MKKLYQIVAEKAALKNQLNEMRKKYDEESKKVISDITKLEQLEAQGAGGLDIDRIQIAERILDVRWNPYWKTGDREWYIADCAILDIANGCEHLKEEFFGNKEYSGYYQRCDCGYWYWPKHGSIVDMIGLRDRKYELTDDEKDACIYYLKNYQEISLKKTAWTTTH